MRTNVLLVEFGVTLDLTLPDLGCPEMPDLWERLHGRCTDGVLRCIDANHPAGAPPWLYLRENSADGTREARHINGGEHLAAGESDEHKALKARIARAADVAGFEAIVEQRSPSGRRRTDVLVKGPTGVLLGCEPQLSPITAPTVRRRSGVARADGITPLWTLNDPYSKAINQAPWARIDRKPWHEIESDGDLPVQAGVRSLSVQRCERRALACPDRQAGRRCNGWHGDWILGILRDDGDPTTMRFDDLIVRAAAADFVPVRQGSGRKASWFWVPAADLDVLEPEQVTDGKKPDPKASEREVDVEPQLIDQVCRWGRQLSWVPTPRTDPDPIRDPVPLRVSSDAAFSLDAARTSGTIMLDWRGASHWAPQSLPCRLCRRCTNMRDDFARPCHKTCAEEELSRA